MGRRDGNADLLPGTLHLMILRTLQREHLHGYAIAKRIRELSGGEFEIEDGSLYPALTRMVLKGWLKAKPALSENQRKIKIYELTPAGRRRLEQESGAFKKMIRAIQLVMKPS
ncbi:MAG TPA: PadR family transcriptional regulator [Bryobacteraceae bacterium]|jgi:transcriptional regulator